MYRKVILEFLTTKHLELSNAKYYQMTICILGHNYQNSLLSLIKNEEEIAIYHVKEPRIYEKSMSFDNLTDNILMMLIELKEEIRFKKEDLNFKLLDPFYLKDLQNQEFQSLQATPIFENDNVVGAVITYFNEDNGMIKYTNNELVKLIHNLDLTEIDDFENQVYGKITSKVEFLLAAISSKQIYLNDNAKKYLGVKNNIVFRNNLKLEKQIQNMINGLGFKKIKYGDLTIYYIECNKLKENSTENMDIFALQCLNSHNFDNDFSYIFVRKSLFSTTSELIKQLQMLNLRLEIDNYKLYEFNDETLIMIIDRVVSSSIIEQIKKYLSDDYLIILTTNKDVTNKMNLIELSKYLYDVQPISYNCTDYIKWLNKKNSEKLSYNDKFKENKLNYAIFNSVDNHVLTKMSMLPLRLEYRDSHFIAYEKIIEKSLICLSKLQEEKIMITIPASLLNKRKTYEDVKKILLNNELWINVIVKGNEDQNEFLKLIAKYKKLSVMMSCDSSVYLNYCYMTTLPLFDGLYIQNSEYEYIKNQDVGLPQVIFDYAIKQYKYLIFEDFNPDQETAYEHFNCYYVKTLK